MNRRNLETANTIVKQIGNQFGIDDLELSSDGLCTIRVDDKFNVFIEVASDTNQIRFYGVVKAFESTVSKNILVNILVENMPSKVKGNSYFAVNRDTRKLLLCSEIDIVSLDFDVFVQRMESFVNYLEIVLEMIRDPNSALARDVDNSKQESHRQPELPRNSATQSKLIRQLVG